MVKNSCFNWIQGVLVTLLLAVTLPLGAQPDRVYTSLSEVRNPEDVYQLKLTYKRYKRIPEQVFTFTHLRVLDLSRNFIDTLPSELGQLTELEVLNLERNRIRTVPDEIGNLRQLRVLNLSRNPILDLPATMGNLQQLEELRIWYTGIIAFPPTFAALNGSLKLIDMRACPMTYANQEEIEVMLPSPRKRWDYTCNCN